MVINPTQACGIRGGKNNTHQTSDLVVKMKYIRLSSAIHLAGSGRGLEPWCLYISEYRCLQKSKYDQEMRKKNGAEIKLRATVLLCMYVCEYA